MSGRAVVWAVAGLVAVVVGASFALSSAALVAVAGWAGVHGPLAACVPVLADGGALAFTLAALVRRAQGRNARAEWASLAVLAVVSVAANVVHAAADVVAEPLRLGVGVAAVGVAPLVVLQATHTLAGLLASLGARAVEPEPVAAASVAFVLPPTAAVEASEVSEDVEPVSGPQTAAERVVVAPSRTWSDVPLWGDDAEPVAPGAVRRVAASREEETAAWRAAREAGESLRAIGQRYGVAPSTVARRLATLDVERGA